jgi:hypothetical protein
MYFRRGRSAHLEELGGRLNYYLIGHTYGLDFSRGVRPEPRSRLRDRHNIRHGCIRRSIPIDGAVTADKDMSSAPTAENYISATMPEVGVTTITGGKVSMSQLVEPLARSTECPYETGPACRGITTSPFASRRVSALI